MRITASIIDEDGYAVEKTCCSNEKSLISQDKLGIFDDVIPRLKHLHLSEDCKIESPKLKLPTFTMKNYDRAYCSRSKAMFTKISTKSTGVIPKSKSSSVMHQPFKYAFAPKPMEKDMDDTTAGVAKVDNAAPSWLMRYLTMMRHQIKKEIMEEICTLCHCSKTLKVEETQLDFQGEVIHTDIFCDNCDQLIHGIRYKCGNCSDFDLCQECESLPNIHNKHHIFLKIRNPMALKLYQRQKLQEISSPTSGKVYMGSRNRQSKKLYEARFVCDETISDGTVLPPSTKFVKSWRVINSGTRVWTHATKLHLIQGSQALVPSSEQIDVPHLKPGEEGVVSVLFTSPSEPGVYRSHWNFCHKSRPFGDIVWCHIMVKPVEEIPKPTVAPEESSPLIPNKLISPDLIAESKQKEVSSIADVLTAVQKEHDRGNLVPRKLAVSSHTATPNNTPFDLTPPKSPDHQTTSVKNLHTVADKNSSHKDSDNEDECSIVSLGSSDSDTEFVVIPMPKCFNLSESFVSQHMPQWLQDVPPESAVEQSVKTVHKIMQMEKQEIGVISEDQPTASSAVRKFPSNSGAVSQETGVPELSVISCDHTVLEIVEKQSQNSSTSYVSVVSDGSSSEISIIESGNSSPVGSSTEQNIRVENATQTIESVNISLSSEGFSLCDVEKQEVNDDSNQNRKSDEVVEQDEDDGNLNSATFPKFPIEGITGTFDPAPLPVPHEERVVQVLPEGLVTGALSAAASVYNTARAVISTIQQPRSFNDSGLSQELPAMGRNESTHPAPTKTLNPMDQLIEMGFCNRQQNEELLRKHNGDICHVVAEYVNLDDNDWYASRHLPISPPTFD